MKSSLRGRKGFTLVELLVVIGIIAVLIGILLPALSKAKRAANTTKCLANLRSLLQGFKLYENEYKGYWPVSVHQPTNHIAIDTERRWPDLIYPMLGGSQVVDTYTDIVKDKKMSAIWGCPEWLAVADKTSQDPNQVRVGYAMNDYTATFWDTVPQGSAEYIKHLAYCPSGSLEGEYPKVTSAYTDPAERLLLMDSVTHVASCPNALPPSPVNPSTMDWYAGNLNSVAANGLPLFYVDARHGKQSYTKAQQWNSACLNAVFCDGHAATISVRDAYLGIRRTSDGSYYGGTPYPDN